MGQASIEKWRRDSGYIIDTKREYIKGVDDVGFSFEMFCTLNHFLLGRVLCTSHIGIA